MSLGNGSGWGFEGFLSIFPMGWWGGGSKGIVVFVLPLVSNIHFLAGTRAEQMRQLFRCTSFVPTERERS